MIRSGILLFLSSGTDTALLITGLLTAAAVLLVLLVVLIPAADREQMARSFARFRQYLLTGTTTRVTEFDHEFDGIRELDNRIPPWFSTLFLASIVIAAVYMLNYHVLGSSKLMVEEYQEEIAEADLQRRVRMASEGSIDENALVALTDGETLTRGGDEYKKYCVSCHGNSGEGLVGPNLTDRYWIHGGSVKEIYRIIKEGVPAKGMISWQLVFTPKQMQELASYVLSLQGTSPLNAKQPEGTLYVPPADTAAVPS